MYYEDSAEWWSRCIEAHKHKDEWLARFVGKEDLESQHELARLHSLLADYEKYKDFEDKVDEFVRDGPNGYGLWCPSAPTLRNRFVKKFNSTKSEYTIPLQSTQIEGEPLAMDCTYATAKKIQVPEIRPPDGSKYPTQWAVSNVQNGGMQYCIHTYMHTYIHTYIHLSILLWLVCMYIHTSSRGAGQLSGFANGLMEAQAKADGRFISPRWTCTVHHTGQVPSKCSRTDRIVWSSQRAAELGPNACREADY